MPHVTTLPTTPRLSTFRATTLCATTLRTTNLPTTPRLLTLRATTLRATTLPTTPHLSTLRTTALPTTPRLSTLRVTTLHVTILPTTTLPTTPRLSTLHTTALPAMTLHALPRLSTVCATILRAPPHLSTVHATILCDATSDDEDDLLNGFDRLDGLDGLDNDGDNTPIDPTGARDLGTYASRHPDKPGQPASKPKDKGKKSTAEKATSALMQEQLKAQHKGLKEAVQRLHDQVKEQADELADTFKLSKAEVHRIIMSTTKMKKPKAYHKFNAKVWRCCQQHNEGKPKGERIDMIQGRAMVRDEPEGTWSQEELDQLKIDWITAQALKKTGTHKTNAKAAKDATVTGDRIFEELLLLERHTGARGFCVIAGAHENDTIRSTVVGSIESINFLPDEAKLVKGPGKKNFVTTTLRKKLREITGKPTLSVEYVRYDEIMRAKEGAELVGWPDMPMMAPLKMSVGGSAAIDTLYERLKAGTCYWRRVNPEVRNELLAKYAGNVKKQMKKRKSTKGKGKDAEDKSDAEETEEEDEAPPPKKKKKARAARDDSDEEEAPPTKKGKAKERKAPAVEEEEEEEEEEIPRRKRKKAVEEAVETVEKVKKKGKGKAADKGKGKKRQRDVEEVAAPKRSALKHRRQAPPGRSVSIVLSDADKSDYDNARADPTNCPSTSASPSAAAASASKSASDVRWDKIRVSDDVIRLSQEAAEKMKAMVAAGRKDGSIRPANPKAPPKPKNLKEIEEEDYEGSSGLG
ncbi:hypothetical protein B0H17DRAFT_1201890 [Mycena rosella]|uniref:Uncharacterized protein n=1 Tax=Mycena rosella TaxID=1033263 RepID=A0AAD7DFE2_MYCRO|nr:hypothetical protein B0H17DRAFT_1201890 [Mycena rosella]